LREEVARLVVDEKLGFKEVSRRLSLPQSTLENWVRAFRAGKLGAVGSSRPPLTEVEKIWLR
jgi:transposase